MDQDIKEQFEQLSKRLGGLATKDDLKGLATRKELEALAAKDDLKGLATKKELEVLASKEDLKELATTKELNKQIESIKTFLYREMPTKQEIRDQFANVPTRKDFSSLQSSVDAYAKQSKDYYQEVTVFMAKVNRMEVWIKEAAGKLGVKYET